MLCADTGDGRCREAFAVYRVEAIARCALLHVLYQKLSQLQVALSYQADGPLYFRVTQNADGGWELDVKLILNDGSEIDWERVNDLRFEDGVNIIDVINKPLSILWKEHLPDELVENALLDSLIQQYIDEANTTILTSIAHESEGYKYHLPYTSILLDSAIEELGSARMHLSTSTRYNMQVSVIELADIIFGVIVGQDSAAHSIEEKQIFCQQAREHDLQNTLTVHLDTQVIYMKPLLDDINKDIEVYRAGIEQLYLQCDSILEGYDDNSTHDEL
jgi:hypothetical protein